MRCPFCTKDAVVATDTRSGDGSLFLVRRRRRCDNCNKRFTTTEITDDEYERLQGVERTMRAMIAGKADPKS